MQRFNTLNEDELNELIKAPMYVGLLLAYADGECDDKEKEWVKKVTMFRTKTSHSTLREYYTKANAHINENMNLFISELPSDSDEIINSLASKVESLKPILAKLDERMSERLVDSYRAMALSVAEISGGIANFFSMKPEEEKYVTLDMLD